MARKRQRSQQEFFDSQEELPHLAPLGDAKIRGDAIALDWSEQGIMTAWGPNIRNITTHVRQQDFSPEEIELLKDYRVYTTVESQRYNSIKLLGDGVKAIPRVLAIYYSFIRQMNGEPCLIVSIGSTNATGGLIAGGQLKRTRDFNAELSLQGIWTKYLEGNAPLRKSIKSLEVKRPDIGKHIFEGFVYALKTGKVFEDADIPLRPPLDFKCCLSKFRAFCQSLDPDGEAKTIILSDWAATHSNLAALLKPDYQTILKPSAKAAFAQAAIGLATYKLEKERQELDKRRELVKKQIQYLDKLTAGDKLFQTIQLAKQITDDLKNISPDSDIVDKKLSASFEVVDRASALRRELKKADALPEDAVWSGQTNLNAECYEVERAIEKLEDYHHTELFINLIKVADRHRSLQEKNARLKQLLDLEDIHLEPGMVLKGKEFDILDVTGVTGSGTKTVVAEVLERGYRLKTSGQVVKKPKVTVRLENGETAFTQPKITRAPASDKKKQSEPKPQETKKASDASSTPRARAGTAPETASKRIPRTPPVIIERAEPAPVPAVSSERRSGASHGFGAAVLVMILALTALIGFLSWRGSFRGLSSIIGNAQTANTNAPLQADSSAQNSTPSNLPSAEQENTNVNSALANTNTDEPAQETGIISLSSNLDDVKVWIDNKPFFLGARLQSHAFNLAPGVHTLKASKGGYPFWARTINLGTGERMPVLISFDTSVGVNPSSEDASLQPMPQPVSAQELALPHLNRATQLYDSGNYEAALAETVEGLRLDSGNQALQRLKARIENARRNQNLASNPAPIVIERPSPRDDAPRPPERMPVVSSQPAAIIRTVIPNYPQTARTLQIAGTVLVQVTINEDGKVVSAKAIQGHPLLRQAAEEAAMKWKFRPAQRDGHPVSDTTTLRFNFTQPR